MIILDTNVVSELMKASPDKNVLKWIASCAVSSLYTTSITKAEILYGINLLPAGKRRTAFESAAEDMFKEDFVGRIVAFGNDAAESYARIASKRSRDGRPISHFDAQIAAIAYSCGANIATRNVRDFDGCGVTVIDPWLKR